MYLVGVDLEPLERISEPRLLLPQQDEPSSAVLSRTPSSLCFDVILVLPCFCVRLPLSVCYVASVTT